MKTALGKAAAAIKTVVLMFAVIALSAGNSHAASRPAAPSIRGGAAPCGLVSVSWNIAAKFARPGTVLEIQRSAGGAATFQTIAQYETPRRKSSYRERPVSGTYLYRARIRTRKGVSRWSRNLLIRVVVPSPAPTPAPVGEVPPDAPLAAGQTLCDPALSVEMLERLNQARPGLPALRLQPNLQWTARAEAVFLAQNPGYCPYATLDTLINQSGFAGAHVSVNPIQARGVSVAELVDYWMSYADRNQANILNPEFVSAGIFCAEEADGWARWVVTFGSN